MKLAPQQLMTALFSDGTFSVAVAATNYVRDYFKLSLCMREQWACI